MVNSVSTTGTGPVDAKRIAPTSAARAPDKEIAPHVSKGSPAARLARLGPPVDMNRVSEIRAAIAQGTYTVDVDRLAAAMLALDLPVRGA